MKTNELCKIVLAFPVNILKGITILVIILLTTYHSKAQITYVDIIPDTTISADSGFYNLDLNNDGVVDFGIVRKAWSLTYSNVTICSLQDSSFVAYYPVESCYNAWPFELNDSINQYNQWLNGSFGKVLAQTGPSYCMHSGSFIGKTNLYLGLKVIKNKHLYYGWLRVDVAADATWFRLKDYAFSGSGFLAGQILNKIDQSQTLKSRINISENATGIVVKPVSTELKFLSATLFNMVSQQSTLRIENNQIVMLKAAFKPGLYLMSLKTSGGQYFSKILIR